MEEVISTQYRRPSLMILVAITTSGALAMNIILPSLPNIQTTFSTDYATVQLTLTLFLFGLAAAQLVNGPLSDCYGRRPIVLAGLGILLIGTLLCLVAPTIEIMILGRIVQAIGGSSGMAMSRAMVRDVYDHQDSAKMIAYLTMIAVIIPTLAPLTGGYIDEWYGWRASFIFILIVSFCFLVTAIIWSPETLAPSNRKKLHFREQFISFSALLKNPLFDGYAFQLSFSTAAYFAFLGGSPFVLIKLMGATPGELGLYFVAISAFYMIGNFGMAKLVRRLGVDRMVTIGTFVSLSGSISMLTIALTGGLLPFSFIGLMSVIAFGNGLSIASGMANAVNADLSRVGAASGLAGFMQMGFGGLASYVASVFLDIYETTITPLVVVIVVCCTLAMLSPIIGQRLETYHVK
ncbi:MAG: multidrug effflux MFS transporter [Proteobacteria bacterium]|nr:multidrug effflux MFS transporter [Pseudomonadota bacterium]